MKRLATAILAIALAGCSQQPTPTTTVITANDSALKAPPITPGSSPDDRPTLDLGRTARMPNGATMQVSRVTIAPAHTAAWVKLCADKRDATVSWEWWTVAGVGWETGGSGDPHQSGLEPLYPYTKPLIKSGTCAEGWIVFPANKTKPTQIRYSNDTRGHETYIGWRV